MRGFLLSCVGLLAGTLLLPSMAAAQSVDVSTGLQARLTYTDNSGTDSSGRSEWIGELTPSIHLSRDRGRLSGRLAADLRNQVYKNDSDSNRSFIGLRASGELEAVENTFFISADSAIGRDNLSPFTGRDRDDVTGGDRGNETRTYSLAPRLEFGLGTFANVRLGHRTRWVDGAALAQRQRQSQWDAGLFGARMFGPLGWGLTYSRSDGRVGGERTDVREAYRGILTYAVNQQLQLRGTLGHERNDFEGGGSGSATIYGGGFDWFPTVRTSVRATMEKREFGTGYDLALQHRHARSTWFVSAGRDLSSFAQRFGSIFSDPEFALLFDSPLLIDLLPDPIEREAFLRAQLQLTGDHFISRSSFVDRRLRGGFTLAGARNSLSVSLLRSDRTSVSGVSGLRSDDLFSAADRVRAESVALSFNHRVSGLSTIALGLTGSEVQARSGERLKTRRYSGSLSYNTRIGPRTVGSLAYRHNRASGVVDYTENLVTGNVGIRF